VYNTVPFVLSNISSARECPFVPVLTPLQLCKLGNYIDITNRRPQREKRGGYVTPGTTNGMVWDYACWNWALTGGVLHVNDPGSAMTIWEDIIQIDIQHNPPIMTGINNVQNKYPGSGADFLTLNNQWQAAKQNRLASQNAFKDAMLRIAARKNGLVPLPGPPGLNTTYTLHMKTSEWESWHHMGIGIKLPYGNQTRQTIVQTVPECPVMHGCSVMWDEGMAETVIGIQELLPQHVNILDRVGPPDQWCCWVCKAVPTGSFRPRKGWHRCDRCFSVFCREHKAALDIFQRKKILNPHTTRICGRNGCVGHTHIV
jgi:hypothetical protein